MTIRAFLLPDLGEGLEDAEVVSWRVAEGDRVELNQVLVEVNTAKALVEIPAPWEGVVSKLHAGEGDVVKVGQPLVSIEVAEAEPATQASRGAGADAKEAATEEDEGAAPSEEARPNRRAVLVGYGVEEDEPAAAASPSREARATDREGPVPASPPVRRLARELGVDLSAVRGTGPKGRITREDVVSASEGPETGEQGAASTATTATTAPAEDVKRVPVKGTRRLIAEKMSRSAREIPHVTAFVTVDAFELQRFRQELSEQAGGRVSPLPVVVRALAEVCVKHPKLNSSYREEEQEIWLHRRCHVGVATDTERGLMVPVVRDADRLGILDVAEEIARLSEAARTGRARPDELVGSTITITNVGSFGSEFGTPIINHPEAAILALGVLQDRALVVDGSVRVRPAVTLSLSFDHRVLDGAEAGRALRALADLLESPFRLGALPRRSPRPPGS